MLTILYFCMLIGIISNALFSSMDRINNKDYHFFEIITLVTHIGIGVYIVYIGLELNYVWQNYVTWLIIYILLRFALYSAIYNFKTNRPIYYLGSWGLDQFLNWLIFKKMNQSPDAIVWLYIMGFIVGTGMYVNLLINHL